MQANEVGWDPATIYVHIDFITRLAVIYLSLTALVLAYRICRWCVVLGFSTVTKTHQLRLALNAIEDTDWPRLRAIGCRFSRWSLHRGLRQWALPENVISRSTVEMIVRQAAEHFRFRWSRETSSIDDLWQWIGTTKLALAIFTVTEITNLFRGASFSKSLGTSVMYGAFAQIGSLWITGLWLILAMYLAHWCFSARLARQREAWQRFEKAFRRWSGTADAKSRSIAPEPGGSNPIL
jgi:hypothetical protein